MHRGEMEVAYKHLSLVEGVEGGRSDVGGV